VTDLRADAGGVVAQLADLGGGLVHEAEVTAGRAHRAGGEQRVRGPRVDQAGDRRIGEIESVVGDHHVQTGGVTTSYLEAIQGRQRDLNGVERGERSGPAR